MSISNRLNAQKLVAQSNRFSANLTAFALPLKPAAMHMQALNMPLPQPDWASPKLGVDVQRHFRVPLELAGTMPGSSLHASLQADSS